MHHHRQEKDVRADLGGELYRETGFARQDVDERQRAEDDVTDVAIEVGVTAGGAEWNILAQHHDGCEQHQCRSKTKKR
jgi:hypothetical protein